MINCPCINCEKKGCGAYHDKCEKYQAFKRDSAAEAKKRKEYEERLKKYHTNYVFYRRRRNEAQ